MANQQKGVLRRLWDKYSEFCKELGIDQGACRSCVPVVKFDEDPPKKAEQEKAGPYPKFCVNTHFNLTVIVEAISKINHKTIHCLFPVLNRHCPFL